MSPPGPVVRRIALAAVAAALAACASSAPPSTPVATGAAASVAPASMAPPPVQVSEFDALRAALPAFVLEKGDAGSLRQGEVSVVRDLSFEADSSILSRTEGARLQPLLTYLRANPTISVRVDGFGDDAKVSERNGDLALARAQTTARALLADIMIVNHVVAVGARMSPSRQRSVEITFISTGASGW